MRINDSNLSPYGDDRYLLWRGGGGEDMSVGDEGSVYVIGTITQKPPSPEVRRGDICTCCSFHISLIDLNNPNFAFCRCATLAH